MGEESRGPQSRPEPVSGLIFFFLPETPAAAAGAAAADATEAEAEAVADADAESESRRWGDGASWPGLLGNNKWTPLPRWPP